MKKIFILILHICCVWSSYSQLETYFPLPTVEIPPFNDTCKLEDRTAQVVCIKGYIDTFIKENIPGLTEKLSQGDGSISKNGFYQLTIGSDGTVKNVRIHLPEHLKEFAPGISKILEQLPRLEPAMEKRRKVGVIIRGEIKSSSK